MIARPAKMPHPVPALGGAMWRGRSHRYTAAPDRGSRRSDRLNRSTVNAPKRRRLAGGAVKWRREAALLPCSRSVRVTATRSRAAAHAAHRAAPLNGSTVKPVSRNDSAVAVDSSLMHTELLLMSLYHLLYC